MSEVNPTSPTPPAAADQMFETVEKMWLALPPDMRISGDILTLLKTFIESPRKKVDREALIIELVKDVVALELQIAKLRAKVDGTEFKFMDVPPH
jgi:hypothetical protein